MQVIQHPEATAELTAAGEFYERQLPTLGAQFLDAMDEAVAEIVAAPKRWRVLDAEVRRYLVPRFPYAIYYRMHSDHIRILAFKHHSRRSAYWRDRISN